MKGIKAAMKPESGQGFGRWTVLDGYITTPQGERKYLCRCDCGTERYVLEWSLQHGGSQSCGCLRMERARQATAYDLFGQTFGAELMSGRKTHCGCKSVKNYASADITGRRFGRLTAQYSTKKRDTKGFVIWHCRCDCGNEINVSYNNLMYCGQQSCGCKKKHNTLCRRGMPMGLPSGTAYVTAAAKLTRRCTSLRRATGKTAAV